ncbi:diphosphate--fructose-6-phosphate 1-phosphotransferase [Anaerococcus hydrogenalis]|uniref:Pyrophosphate--fructose 6-phosphate 1-phosphotransferase n=1 Tax=Anaerococcus hydrogenalis TaxID=33029 RepID=A0A2N6UIP6_9FIRM|nr:diphosphate--fructose-6-phosphate 1-phosphotransferase [Anaerococcus hydrogenalis]MBS5988170.1 diphosphate--fructose-6-phosphate 1-phosphotransferase [Anaerococcus hydrogenalis]MDK7694827.1 diphosphate--fructose-6-phosphate 1-phosphotransferase [Anaerococcus hydrogenalis]MDK7696619.1 diphosphate--fructose-6-phosphate 1-phosphotransferase [Anaerococcus hydrogenalis]MDK7707854.1 diphosphate--fructose-6-phosphate 1-phosphotransferase [Anaerococcus hydrogenalis]PMC81463.1 6-phosphogluconate deh
MNCLVGQSGGPTAVINSSLAGVIQAGIDLNYDGIFLSLNGIEGIINKNIKKVDKDLFEKNFGKDRLKKRPSSILGSCRYKLPEDLDDEVYGKIFENFKTYKIDTFVYIGGNDSMDTVMKLNAYIEKNKIDWINVVGCPKTIDNDLCEMDHSPGFGSAAKFVNTVLRQVRLDCDIYPIKSITFVEIMGRNAGWLTATSYLSNYKRDKDVVNLLYLPEDEKSLDDIKEEIKEKLKEDNNLVVAVSEGFMDKDYLLENEKQKSFDKGFNHPIIAGIGQKISDYIHKELEIKTRCVELNIVQRTSFLISKTDSDEAFELGYLALKEGKVKTNIVPFLKREENNPYKVSYSTTNPANIANKEKKIPKEWLANRKVLEEKMIEYALPLVQGQIDQEYSDGIFDYIKLEDFAK